MPQDIVLGQSGFPWPSQTKPFQGVPLGINRLTRNPAIGNLRKIGNFTLDNADFSDLNPIEQSSYLAPAPVVMGQIESLWSIVEQLSPRDINLSEKIAIAQATEAAIRHEYAIVGPLAGNPASEEYTRIHEIAQAGRNAILALPSRSRALPVSQRTEENVSVAAATRVDCFNYPAGATPEERAEFRRQLKMQEDALNQNPIQDTLNRLNNRLLRDTNAQQKYRDKNGPRWITDRTQDIREIYGLSKAAAFAKASVEFAAQAVLHRIDMIAGGLPTDFGGFGDSRINSSIGAQWKGGRREQLRQALEEQQADGKKRPQITLEIC